MTNRKPNVLIVGEYSQFNTGFATYFYYLLPRLFKTQKFNLAELAVYLHPMHPKMEETPWKVFPNEPSPQDPEEVHRAYQADPINQFGKFRFNQACLEFKPDIVINIADPWMASWINESPYRKYFHYIHMPTVDGQVQKAEWMEDYAKCDTIFTYSEFGKYTLETQSGGKIKVAAVASPAADVNVFKPAPDKDKVKAALGLPTNSVIIQTVMRNQPRKLFPEILKTFNILLEKMEKEGKSTNDVYLHFHTSNPDMGWDLPAEVKNHGLSHKVFFTYMCDQCGLIRCFRYRQDRTVCPACGQSGLRLPNTSAGCTREQLATIMSAADVYLQYSICEGFGMPIVDAKACGVPTVVVNYSAMAELGTEASGGCQVPLLKLWQEPATNTNQLRAIPDNNQCADILYNLTVNSSFRTYLGGLARKWAEEYYNWDRTAKIWEYYLDGLEVSPENKWESPVTLLQPIGEIPQQVDNIPHFVMWVCQNIFKNPQMFYSNEVKNWITWANQGYLINQDGHGRKFTQKFGIQELCQLVNNKVNYHNHFEMMRYNASHPVQRKPQIGVTL